MRRQTGLITILFTDLVGSTALKQQVGGRIGEMLRGWRAPSGEEIAAKAKDKPEGKQPGTGA